LRYHFLCLLCLFSSLSASDGDELQAVQRHPEDESNPPIILSGDEISDQFANKCFSAYLKSLASMESLRLNVRQRLIVHIGEDEPRLVDSFACSVLDPNSDDEYFARINSRVDTPTDQELKQLERSQVLKAMLRYSARSTPAERLEILRELEKVTTGFSVRPGAAFCMNEGKFRLLKIDSSDRKPASRKAAIMSTGYVPYRRAPLILASTVAMPHSTRQMGMPSFISEKPALAIMHDDGSVRAIWEKFGVHFSVRFDSQLDNLPTEFAVFYDKQLRNLLAKTNVEWSRSENGDSRIQTVVANYGQPKGKNDFRFYASVDYSWSELTPQNRKDYLSLDSFDLPVSPFSESEETTSKPDDANAE